MPPAKKKVAFDPNVSVRRLPYEQMDAAWKARNGHWKEAPQDDELWDGDLAQFRSKELTPEELKRILRVKRLSALPRGLSKPIMKVFKVMKKWGALEGVDMVGAHARHVEVLDTEQPARLMRKVSGSARSPTPLAAPWDGDLEESCARYLNLSQQCLQLPTVREAELQADNALTLSKHELASVKQELRNLRNDIPVLEARLYRNANPRLLHYLQFDREQKVKSLQQDLDSLYRSKAELQSRVEILANLISEQTAQHELVMSELQRLVEAERERRLLMESVLAVTAPTPELALLESQQAECQAELGSEEALLAAVKFSREQMERSFEQLGQAMALLAEAGAVTLNPMSAVPSQSPVRGPIRRPSSAARQQRSDSQVEEDAKLDVMRRALASRDDKINQARDLAIEAAQRITDVLKDFPPAAKERVPALYLNLMSEDLPDLTSQEVFGPQKRFSLPAEAQAAVQLTLSHNKPSSGFGFGKAMNEKIMKKSAAVKACKDLTTKYLDALRSADVAISARVRELKETLTVKLAAQLAEERKRSMEALCKRLAEAPPPAPPLIQRSPSQQQQYDMLHVAPKEHDHPPFDLPRVTSQQQLAAAAATSFEIPPPVPSLSQRVTSVSQIYPKIEPEIEGDTTVEHNSPPVAWIDEAAFQRLNEAGAFERLDGEEDGAFEPLGEGFEPLGKGDLEPGKGFDEGPSIVLQEQGDPDEGGEEDNDGENEEEAEETQQLHEDEHDEEAADSNEEVYDSGEEPASIATPSPLVAPSKLSLFEDQEGL